jgi:sialate O-acetylesterase
MERELGPRAGQKPIVGWEEAVASADFPLIRQFHVWQDTADTPQAEAAGGWLPCTPQTAADFSAVGFFFARAMHLAREGVPVGMIHTSWGGTVAEAWMSKDGLTTFPEFEGAIEAARRAQADPERAHREYQRALEVWYRANDPGTKAQWWKPGRDPGGWETMTVPNIWEDAGFPDWDGVAWMRRTFDLPGESAGSNGRLLLAAVDDVDTTWVNGVEVGTTTFYSTMRAYDIPASALKPTGNEIRVRILDTGGGGGIWNNRLKLEIERGLDSVSLAGPWQIHFAASLADVPPPPPAPVIGGPNVPTVLYNAMLAPLAPYAIRGAIFYQGESNATRATQYRKLLPALIADWRRTWGQGDFPFLFVQIAPFQGQPPEIREAQLLAWQATEKTAMVVTIDVGDATDIHPANKRPVGERLALAARAVAYGEDIPYSGPVYASMAVDGGSVVLRFTHVDGGLVAPGGTLQGFTIAGADGVFHDATARIEGNTVLVSAAQVANPIAVRYGWANVASGNLFNSAGLPASPFRTDAPKD